MTANNVLHQQRVLPPEDIGLVSIGPINHVVGVTAVYLARPEANQEGAGLYTSDVKTLFLKVESGSFRLQLGDTHAALTTTPPASSITNGTGSLLIKATDLEPYTFTAPDGITVVGASAGDILTYWWV